MKSRLLISLVCVAALTVLAAPETDTYLNKLAFDTTLTSMRENYEYYQKNVLATVPLLILAIGWSLTSETARGVFKASRTSRITFVITIVLVMSAHSGALLFRASGSERYAAQLAGMKLIDANAYSLYVISKWQLVATLVVEISLAAVLAVIVWLCRTPADNAAEDKLSERTARG